MTSRTIISDAMGWLLGNRGLISRGRWFGKEERDGGMIRKIFISRLIVLRMEVAFRTSKLRGKWCGHDSFDLFKLYLVFVDSFTSVWIIIMNGYWNKHVDYKLRTNPKLQFVTKSKATVAIKCHKNVWDKYRDQTKIVITVKPIWKL